MVGAVAGGIIAAQNGGNVLTGIGIGAASGALIGTGVGAAAGAALAGSITATTGAVVAGGGTLAATVSAGGVGAGAAYVANNLAQAANNITPAAQTVASKMQDVATKGKNGELLSGLVKNTTRIPSLTGTAAYRIPDGLVFVTASFPVRRAAASHQTCDKRNRVVCTLFFADTEVIRVAVFHKDRACFRHSGIILFAVAAVRHTFAFSRVSVNGRSVLTIRVLPVGQAPTPPPKPSARLLVISASMIVRLPDS